MLITTQEWKVREHKDVFFVPWFNLFCRRTSHHAILDLLELQSQKKGSFSWWLGVTRHLCYHLRKCLLTGGDRNALQEALPKKGTSKFSSSFSKAELILPGRVVGWDLTRGTKVCDHKTLTAVLYLSRNMTVGKVYWKHPTDLQSKECPGCIYHAPNESFSASESTATSWTPSAIRVNKE